MKGSGSGTYYLLGDRATISVGLQKNTGDNSVTPYISSLSEDGTPYVNPLYKGLDAIPKEFPALSENLKKEIMNFPRRCSKRKFQEIIKKLCSLSALQPSQLGQILDRDAQYLRINFLSKMLKSGELVYLYPDQPAHPQQAYKTPNEEEM